MSLTFTADTTEAQRGRVGMEGTWPLSQDSFTTLSEQRLALGGTRRLQETTAILLS